MPATLRSGHLLTDSESVSDSVNETASKTENAPKTKKMANATLPYFPCRFSTADPGMWFQQVEAYFDLHQITDDNKKVIFLKTSIDTDILSRVHEYFDNPPTEDKYNKLKKMLVAQFSETAESNIRKLLRHVQLGDRKPSELLREMRKLAGGQMSEDLLRNLFMERLPEPVRFVLIGTTESLEKIAEKADRMMECPFMQPPQVSAIQSTNSTQLQLQLMADQNKQILDQLRTLSTQYIELSNRIQQVELNNNNYSASNHYSRPRYPSRDGNRRTRSPSSSAVPEGIKLCYYHYKFGTRAQKCKPLPDGSPCTYQNTGN